MKKHWIVLLCCLCLCALAQAQPRNTEDRPADDGVFSKYLSSGELPSLGSNIQTSLSKMVNANCRKDHVIRILFYGQSITEQGWWIRIVEYLKAEYPDVKFDIENRAIGGHSSDKLLKTAEADVYRFNPDLLIFHVYGSHTAYEALIQNIRERTTADVIIANDHVTKDSELNEETSPWKLKLWRYTRWFSWFWNKKPQFQWEAWMNHVFLPELADKYKLDLVDMRSQWKKYLLENNMKANQLLIDDVHLNANGEYLMAEIMKMHLSRKNLQSHDCGDAYVTEFTPQKSVVNGNMTYEFKIEGTRLEVSFDKPNTSEIEVNIDGVAPSQHFDAYDFTRSSVFPGTPWPALLQIHKGTAHLQEEVWSACVEPAKSGAAWYAFDLTGSKTGFDGKGQTNMPFLSNSSRIVIEPEDWNLNYAQTVWNKVLDNKTCFRWNALSSGADKIQPNNNISDILLFTGLTNEKHIVTLRSSDLISIRNARVFQPPLKCTRFASLKFCHFKY